MATSDMPLFDRNREDYGRVVATGDHLKPWLKGIKYLVDECRIHIDGGFTVDMADAANVAYIHTTLREGAFEAFDAEGVVGVNMSRITHLARRARVNTDDEISLDFGDNTITSEISREYDDTGVTTVDSMATIDPASIRSEPDMPGLDFDYTAEVSTEAFVDALDHLNGADTGIEFKSRAGSFTLSTMKSDSGVMFDDVALSVDNPTVYSIDYISTLRDIVKKSRAESVTLSWSDDYPIQATFERTDDDGDVIADYEYMVAPRIRE